MSHLGRARLVLLISSVACFGVMIALGLELHSVRGPIAVNERARRLVFSHLFGVSVVPEWAARAYRQMGQPVPFAILVSAIVIGLLWRRDLADAVVAALGAPIAVLLADAVAKPVFDRARSPVSQFPSGHTTAMTALAVVLVLVAYRRWGQRGVLISLPAAVWVSGSMILTVIRLHEHMFTDAIGGVLLGVGTVTAVAAVVPALGPVLAAGPAASRLSSARDVARPGASRLSCARDVGRPGVGRFSSSRDLGRRRAGRFISSRDLGRPGVGRLSSARDLGRRRAGRLSSAAAPRPVPAPASAAVPGPDTASDGGRRPR